MSMSEDEAEEAKREEIKEEAHQLQDAEEFENEDDVVDDEEDEGGGGEDEM